MFPEKMLLKHILFPVLDALFVFMLLLIYKKPQREGLIEHTITVHKNV